MKFPLAASRVLSLNDNRLNHAVAFGTSAVDFLEAEKTKAPL